MKRRIRRGVFETNSSSMHSLTVFNDSDDKILENSNLKTDDENYLHVRLWGYGWGYDLLETQQEKLSYVIATIVCSKDIESQEELENDETFKYFSKEICNHTGAKGIIVDNFLPENIDNERYCFYIDHQSNDGPSLLIGDEITTWNIHRKEWEELDDISVLDVIFNSNYAIRIANDNEDFTNYEDE